MANPVGEKPRLWGWLLVVAGWLLVFGTTELVYAYVIGSRDPHGTVPPPELLLIPASWIGGLILVFKGTFRILSFIPSQGTRVLVAIALVILQCVACAPILSLVTVYVHICAGGPL